MNCYRCKKSILATSIMLEIQEILCARCANPRGTKHGIIDSGGQFWPRMVDGESKAVNVNNIIFILEEK